MRFVLIDRITELEPGKRIVAHKAVSLAEEYLADHFPTFPVLPGVFMLEALVQASAWVARAGLDFRPSLVVLKDARNVTYKSFCTPGQILTIQSECKELTAEQSVFAASGMIGDREIVKGRLTLRHLCLADSDPKMAETDEQLRQKARSLFGLVWSGKQT
ncbi:MAG: 3-hydroxyacyl-ACP dehydratase FabZ family protein [Phycisphaerae bacterium]